MFSSKELGAVRSYRSSRVPSEGDPQDSCRLLCQQSRRVEALRQSDRCHLGWHCLNYGRINMKFLSPDNVECVGQSEAIDALAPACGEKEVDPRRRPAWRASVIAGTARNTSACPRGIASVAPTAKQSFASRACRIKPLRHL